MRVLHTSDWHIGRTLYGRKRYEEFEAFLNWLAIDADKKTRLKEQEKCSKAHETLELVNGYLKEHAPDEWLIGGLAGVEEQVSGLLSRQNEILQKETDHDKAANVLDQAAKSLDDYQKKSSIRKQELEDASKQILQGKDALS